MNPKITALLVMARESRLPLFEQLEGCGIEVLPVSTCQEARRALVLSLAVQVVIVDVALPDGSWCQVLEDVAQWPGHAEVIVRTHVADQRLWREVVARGASDLLLEPCQPEEMKRIIEAAVARSYMRSLQPTRPALVNVKVA